MERNTSDPTIIASAELPRRGREDEPRHLYIHDRGDDRLHITMELRGDSYEDMVGPDAYQDYLKVVDAHRGTHYADPNYVPFAERQQPARVDRLTGWLAKLGINLV